MKNAIKSLMTGNEAVVKGAIDAGAEFMFGYPITPATEILQSWIKECMEDKSLNYLQTEDETAAGFALCGAISAGVKSFTATAGPGHVLMQDPLSMAENLRLPFVGVIMQRGGPSTGTVNFSQQELNLASFGGNGEGLRVVFSSSDVEELYYLTIKSFDIAWKYHFPTLLLGDGYLGKMQSKVILKSTLKPVQSTEILKKNIKKPTYLRNCYSDEESFAKKLNYSIKEWENARDKLAESEMINTGRVNQLIIAHGLVASAVKEAINNSKKNVGLFRPITVHPIDRKNLMKAIKHVEKIHIFESSYGQFTRIIKNELYGQKIPIEEHFKPAEGFTPDEIIKKL